MDNFWALLIPHIATQTDRVLFSTVASDELCMENMCDSSHMWFLTGRTGKKAAYGRVPDPAEGQSPAVLVFLVFFVNNFGDEHVRRAQAIGANLSWVLKNSLEFLKNFWWRNHSKIRSSSRVKLKRNIRSYLRSSLLFFEFKYLIPEIKLFW